MHEREGELGKKIEVLFLIDWEGDFDLLSLFYLSNTHV